MKRKSFGYAEYITMKIKAACIGIHIFLCKPLFGCFFVRDTIAVLFLIFRKLIGFKMDSWVIF